MKNEPDTYAINVANGSKLVATCEITVESAERFSPTGTARFFEQRARRWNDARGRDMDASLADPDLALVATATAWHGDAANPQTELSLWAVPLGKTGEFVRDNVGAVFGCTDAGTPFDCWMADDFCDVEGVNPVSSLMYGINEDRVYPGPCVLAGSAAGKTVSIRDARTIGTIAYCWARASLALARAAAGDPGILTVAGGETMDMDMESGPDGDGGFSIRIGARTPDGSPLARLVAALCADAGIVGVKAECIRAMKKEGLAD